MPTNSYFLNAAYGGKAKLKMKKEAVRLAFVAIAYTSQCNALESSWSSPSQKLEEDIQI